MSSHASFSSSASRSGGGVRLIHAALAADGDGVMAAPAALLLEGGVVRAVGTPQQVGTPEGVSPEVYPDSALIPALVNAHAHLDLTCLGCWLYRGDFDEWLGDILKARMAMTPESVDESIRQGVRASLAGGIAAVGDIAGRLSPEPAMARMSEAGMWGVVYTEVFGMGLGREPALAQLQQVMDEEAAEAGGERHLRRGIQPHAPYSSHPEVYRRSLASSLPVSTHLSESPEELEFIRHGTGRFRHLLEQIGMWDGSADVGARHPVDWLAKVLAGDASGMPILCAHCNYVDDQAMDLLACGRFHVAYCPRSSTYFGHRGHRYRQMLERGITVALGTDSMVCLDTPDRISTLDELRLLMVRDGLPLEVALAMATVNGARALGLPVEPFTLAPGGSPKAGILRVPLADGPSRELGGSPAALGEALARGKAPPRWLFRQGEPPARI